MARPELLGIGALSVGAALGFIMGGPGGLVLAALCLIVGLVLLVSADARGTKAVGVQATRPAHQKTQVLLLVKDVHARPQRAGKFQEIQDPNQADLEFELFLHCWLVNETDLPLLRIVEGPQLTLTKPSAPPVIAERIHGDLENWRLGKLNREPDLWDAFVLRAAQEDVSELNTDDPLECGVAREGWLHFRVRNLTPAEFRAASMEISVKDSLSNNHVCTAAGHRHLPGRMWPFRPKAERTIEDAYPASEASIPPGS